MKWGEQLQTIHSMGIQAEDATILQLLEVYNGNIEIVINQLLDSM